MRQLNLQTSRPHPFRSCKIVSSAIVSITISAATQELIPTPRARLALGSTRAPIDALVSHHSGLVNHAKAISRNAASNPAIRTVEPSTHHCDVPIALSKAITRQQASATATAARRAPRRRAHPHLLTMPHRRAVRSATDELQDKKPYHRIPGDYHAVVRSCDVSALRSPTDATRRPGAPYNRLA